MGIISSRIEIHWNYLLAIERDLERLSRFVEFDERNFSCFSIEVSRILLASGAEVDVVCKQICKEIKLSSKANSINGYRAEILPTFSAIPSFEVLLPRYGFKLIPWLNWSLPGGVPEWWTAYNKIKHHRDEKYHLGNLKNALNAVAGLFIVVLFLYREKVELGELIPMPRLFRPSEQRYLGTRFGGYEFGIAVDLK